MIITSCNLSKFEMVPFNNVLFADEKIRRLPLPFDNYYITSNGRVLSTKWNKIRELKQPTMDNCYHVVCLHGAGKPQVHYVHRLMIKAFYGIDTTYQLQTRHLDGNKANNRLDNLLPGTPQENAEDKKRHGRCTSKLSAKAVQQMRLLWDMRGFYNVPEDIDFRDIARIWKVSPETARKAIVRETWTYLD